MIIHIINTPFTFALIESLGYQPLQFLPEFCVFSILCLQLLLEFASFLDLCLYQIGSKSSLIPIIDTCKCKKDVCFMKSVEFAKYHKFVFVM